MNFENETLKLEPLYIIFDCFNKYQSVHDQDIEQSLLNITDNALRTRMQSLLKTVNQAIRQLKNQDNDFQLADLHTIIQSQIKHMKGFLNNKQTKQKINSP